MKPPAALAFGAVCLASLPGCPRRAPRVGFQSDAAAVITQPTDAATADVARFVVVEAQAVLGRTLTVDGASIEAPARGALGLWLRLDLDGDGTRGDVAVTASGAEQLAAPLMIFRREGEGFTRVQFSEPAPSDPRCSDASLRLSSPRSLVVGWRCPQTPSDGGVAPTYTLEEALLSLGATPRVRERAALRRPSLPDTSLSLVLEGADLDGDGTDEVIVNVLAGPAGQRPRASVRSVFYDRPGGRARDVLEPGASFEALIERARRAINPRRRSSVSQVLGALDDVSRLRRAACQASATARLDLSGAAMDCSRVSFERASEVHLRALTAAAEFPGAWALTRRNTSSEFGVATSPRALSDLRRASVAERDVTARRGPMLGSAVPEGSFGARFGALVFDPPVNPTGITVRGVSSGRVDLVSMTFLGDPAGAPGELLARSPDGTSAIVGFADTCSGLAAVRCDPLAQACLDFARRPAGGPLPEALSGVNLGGPLAPSVALRCLSDPRASEWLGASPRGWVLSWPSAGALLSVNGRLATLSENSVFYGVDGVGASLASPEGVWLRDRAGWKLLAPPELAGRYADLTDLAASSDGRLVAAMLGQEVWVLERTRAPVPVR